MSGASALERAAAVRCIRAEGGDGEVVAVVVDGELEPHEVELSRMTVRLPGLCPGDATGLRNAQGSVESALDAAGVDVVESTATEVRTGALAVWLVRVVGLHERPLPATLRVAFAGDAFRASVSRMERTDTRSATRNTAGSGRKPDSPVARTRNVKQTRRGSRGGRGRRRARKEPPHDDARAASKSSSRPVARTNADSSAKALRGASSLSAANARSNERSTSAATRRVPAIAPTDVRANAKAKKRSGAKAKNRKGASSDSARAPEAASTDAVPMATADAATSEAAATEAATTEAGSLVETARADPPSRNDSTENATPDAVVAGTSSGRHADPTDAIHSRPRAWNTAAMASITPILSVTDVASHRMTPRSATRRTSRRVRVRSKTLPAGSPEAGPSAAERALQVQQAAKRSRHEFDTGSDANARVGLNTDAARTWLERRAAAALATNGATPDTSDARINTPNDGPELNATGPGATRISRAE